MVASRFLASSGVAPAAVCDFAAAFNVFIIGSNMAGKILFLVLAVPSLETRKELLVLFLYFLIFGIFFLLATGSANGG